MMRIDVKHLILGLALMPAAHGQNASDARIRFLSREEGRVALTEGAERNYYTRLQLGEMRAKTGLALQGVTLGVAREQTRKAYGEQVAEFSPAERSALNDAIATLQPVLKVKAPLYARTPWAFIKTSTLIEGGLPHTRGDFIVLSDKVLVDIVRMHEEGELTAPAGLWNLLLHEQTHVLERRHAAAFAALFTADFGFRRIKLAAAPAWLTEVTVVDPDAPETGWVFPVGEGAAQHWVLPAVVLENVDQPRMPEDFNVVALTVQERNGLWFVTDLTKPDPYVELSRLPPYDDAFPDHDEIFHPDEIAAELLAAQISGWGVKSPDHPLWAKLRTWSRDALK